MTCCVNLRRREDRWKSFGERLPIDWPFGQVIRFPAIDGLYCRHPSWWQESDGAWGCYRSHLRIVEECLNCNIESVLVLEDDAVFLPGFSENVALFFQHLPSDWEMVYLGGQLLKSHLRPPEKINEHVFRPFNVNRTHAYAVRGKMLEVLYQHYIRHDWYPNHHVDHHLGRLHETGVYRIYTPARWLVGQLGDSSDISGQTTSNLFWEHPESAATSAPVTYVAVLGLHDSGASEVAMVLHHLGIHMGDDLGGFGVNGGGEDRQLAEVCERAIPFPSTELEIPTDELEDRFSSHLGHQMWCATRQSKIAGGKYPHLCLFGPMLKRWCGEQLRVIYVERPIVDAINSLTRRMPMVIVDPRAAEQTASRIQGELEQEKRGFLSTQSHLTNRYDDLKSSPESQVQRLVKYLSISVEEATRDRAVEYLRSCRW